MSVQKDSNLPSLKASINWLPADSQLPSPENAALKISLRILSLLFHAASQISAIFCPIPAPISIAFIKSWRGLLFLPFSWFGSFTALDRPFSVIFFWSWSFFICSSIACFCFALTSFSYSATSSCRFILFCT